MEKLTNKSTTLSVKGRINFRLVLVLILLVTTKITLAQDTIFLRNETVVPAKINEITTMEIKYKKLDNPDGPVYTLLKSEIKMIKYKNGSEDVFEESETESGAKEQGYSNVPPEGVNAKNVDFILTKSGLKIYCIIDKVGTYTIRYHTVRRGPDLNQTIGIADVSEYMLQNRIKIIAPINYSAKKDDDLLPERRHYSGPRVGMTFAGPGAFNDALTSEGKRNIYSQFGWQFETRMFTLENGLSGMLEFIPLVGGLDMAKFIPSFSGLVGLRTKDGTEFGVGPNWGIYFGKYPNGGGNYVASNLGIVIAVGMSIKSGKVYFPINLAFVPSVTKQSSSVDPTTNKTVTKNYQTGMKLSLLIGFNNRKR